MSGPKDYSPPPSYSLQVFDGQLNEVFQLQSKINLLCEEMNSLHVNDQHLTIQFDCKDQLKQMENELQTALKRLNFKYKGAFGQETYNKISIEIQDRIQQLQHVLLKCNEIVQDFHRKEADYKAYLEYHNLYEKSKQSFIIFKDGVGSYLKNNAPEGAKDISESTQIAIQKIMFDEKKAPFDFGFNLLGESLKNTIVNQVYKKEKEINTIRIDFSDKIIERYPSLQLKKEKSKSVPAVEKIIEKIMKIIASGLEPQIADGYRKELDDLKHSESLTDIFYYNQLHDRILKLENTKRLKLQIQKNLVKINALVLHQSIGAEKANLTNYCVQLLEKETIDVREINRVHEVMENLKIKSDSKKQKEEIAENERIFLKGQIVNSLENMGYEVLDDLEVIDFEKADDILLKCKDNINYLNLKFKEDGSVRYVFQIPENKQTLSDNELNNKLFQMDETCNDFRSVLSDLEKMGLRMELRDAKPTSEKWLLTLTEKQKEKLKPGKRKKKKKEDQKKYLD